MRVIMRVAPRVVPPVNHTWSDPPASALPAPHASGRRQPSVDGRALWLWMAVPWLGLLAGTLVVAYAYAYAATVFTGQAEFHLFWLGMLLFLVPACLRLCQAGVLRTERLALVSAVGLFNDLPKFLRNPQYPLFHDELAHWRQAEVIYRTGRPFQPNPTIDIIQFFPGLHTLTAALRDLSGLSTFQIAIVLLAVLHIVAVVGIFLIAERITRSPHTAALAAFIYSLNPSFMFFDTQYAYESLAIVFVIWVLLAVVNLQAAQGDRLRQAGWFVVGLVLAGGCIVTHHLSSYIMVLVLLLVMAVTVVRAMRGVESRATALVTVCFAVIVAASAVAWLLLVASDTVRYLTPHLTNGIAQVFKMMQHEQQSRQLFAFSTTPGYERLCAFVSPVIAAAGAATGLWLRRRLWLRSSAALALVLFGLLYFLSVPFMLTQAGNEGARRSWAYTYVGLCILAAPVIPWLLRRVAQRRAVVRRCAQGGVVACLAVVLVGNLAMAINETYRFPGPYVYGSDTRSLTGELLAMTRWFRATQGPNQRVVSDRFSGLALASFGNDWTAAPSYGFPVWQLYVWTRRPTDSLLGELRSSHYSYVIVDKRMARYLPWIGVYFEPDEPTQISTRRPSLEALTKYDGLPWTIKIFESDNLAVYRFNFAALNTAWISAPARGGQA